MTSSALSHLNFWFMFAVQFPEHLPIPASFWTASNRGRLRRFSSVGSCGPGLLLCAIMAALTCASCPGARWWPPHRMPVTTKIITFLIGNPGTPINLHLPLASCEGATSNFASSSILIDPSNVRPIFSAAEIVSFVWTAYLSFARGANKWADAGWGCLLECHQCKPELADPLWHHNGLPNHI